MQTMHPSIMLGPCGWLQDRLPIDEFRLRLDAVHASMARRGWDGLLVYGDAGEHAALAFVSNFIPRMRWGMALISRDGRNRLLCAMSTRDLPAMRAMTWIEDVQSGWEWERAFDPWLTQLGASADPAHGSAISVRVAESSAALSSPSLNSREGLESGGDGATLPNSPPPPPVPRVKRKWRRASRRFDRNRLWFSAPSALT